jgi:hypothetical protein
MITLKEACEITEKSEVTIRRLVKKGKVTSRKDKTSTGFVYLIDKESLLLYYNPAYSNNDQATSQTDDQSPNLTSRKHDQATSQPDQIDDQVPSQQGDQAPMQATIQNLQNDTNTEVVTPIHVTSPTSQTDDQSPDQPSHINDQATDQKFISFIKQELIKLQEELKTERLKKEEYYKEKEEKITKLQEDIGQLRGQIGFWEGQAKAFEKQLRLLQAPDLSRYETTNQSRGDNISEQPLKPDTITVQSSKVTSIQENSKQKDSDGKNEHSKPKYLTIVFWIILVLILAGLTPFIYTFFNSHFKF